MHPDGPAARSWKSASHSRERRLYNHHGGGNSSTGRAPDCGSDGCGFDSRFPPQNLSSSPPLSSGRRREMPLTRALTP
jgi:hypothetical protein